MKPISLILTLLLAVGGCDAVVEPDRTFDIDGVVVDAASGAPLDSIAVELDRAAFSGPVRPILAESITDGAGRYRVQRGRSIAGSYRIFATDLRLFQDGPGYYVVDGVNDFPVQPGDHRSIDIEMVWVER